MAPQSRLLPGSLLSGPVGFERDWVQVGFGRAGAPAVIPQDRFSSTIAAPPPPSFGRAARNAITSPR